MATSSSNTPQLDALFERLGGRIRRSALMHGIGTLAAALAILGALAFVLDWGLRAPAMIRVPVTLAAAAALGYLFWRELLGPLRRVPGRTGLAVLLGRDVVGAEGAGGDLLVSAVQFQADAANDPGDLSPMESELRGRVVRAAEARAPEIDPLDVLAEAPPRRRSLVGGLAVGAVALLASQHPMHARTFMGRLAGGGPAWPKRTELLVELPGEALEIERSPELVRITVARGSDLQVIVRAVGEVPQDVRLVFDGGDEQALKAGSRAAFRTRLIGLQEPMAFHAEGGDDTDRIPRIEVRVLRPPQVSELAIQVTPPTHTGVAPYLVRGGDAEVPAGSRVVFFVRPDPDDATGVLRLVPAETTLPLTPATFPGSGSGAESDACLSASLVATETTGLRFELVDAEGLTDPDPGLTRLVVQADRAPEVRLLAPRTSEALVVAGGAVALRILARDDHGLASLSWKIPVEDEDGPARPGSSFPMAMPPSDGTPQQGPRREIRSAVRLEVDRLFAQTETGGAVVGQRVEIEVMARDNRPAVETGSALDGKADGIGRAAPLTLRLVSADTFLRRLQDALARARMDTQRLAERQYEVRQRISDLIAALDDESDDDGVQGGSVLRGTRTLERRLAGETRDLSRLLAEVLEDLLYARVDERAGDLLDTIDQRLGQDPGAGFEPEAWRELVTVHAAGVSADSGFAGRLVPLLGVALDLSEQHSPAVLDALDRAREATPLSTGASGKDGTVYADALAQAEAAAERAMASLENLLARLAAWDNFQNVLSLTRDILGRQKALKERARAIASDPGTR